MPVMVDLCCGAGAAAMGYDDAGFTVVGVDINPQPRFPFCFIQADVTELDLPALIEETGASAVHASPPCQLASRLRHYQPFTIDERYPDLIPIVREKLQATGLPYVIENVRGAKLVDPIELCGCMFNDLMVYRPRRFEMNFKTWNPRHKPHRDLCVRNGYMPTPEQPRMSIHGGKHSRAWQRKACEVMDVPWMAIPADASKERTTIGIRELCQAIPPAYTRHIGSQLINSLEVKVA